MKVPQKCKVKDWESFIKQVALLTDCPPYKPNYLFRGQADASWELDPSLVRYAKTYNLNIQQILELEEIGLAEFQKQAHLYLSTPLIPDQNDVSAWWIRMQHYGAPTRILDWTHSAFVALYFAVEQDLDKDGAVWVFHPHTLQEYMKKTLLMPELSSDDSVQRKYYRDKNAKEHLRVMKPRTQTERMIAQQIALTISPSVLANHGKILESALSSQEKISTYVKFVIPKKLKLKFLRNLWGMNVTARTLFPGIDGLGRSVGELIKLGL